MWEIDDGVWSRASGVSGPHLLVLGGVHGNELPGILAVRELLTRFGVGNEPIACGTLTLAFGNPVAIARGERGSGLHRDLNRCFLPHLLTNPRTYEERRAALLARYIDAADAVLDLHATNKPSVPFLATTLATPEHHRLAQAFPCERMVTVSPSAIEGTTDGYINGRGTGFIYEAGLASDVSTTDATLASVLDAMALLGMLPDRALPSRPPKRGYALTEALRLTEAGFRFADGRGRESFEPMRAGDVIGFADTTPVVAPFDGVILFPKISSLWKVGSPLCFFAESLPDP
jgi:predicted deacylase